MRKDEYMSNAAGGGSNHPGYQPPPSQHSYNMLMHQQQYTMMMALHQQQPGISPSQYMFHPQPVGSLPQTRTSPERPSMGQAQPLGNQRGFNNNTQIPDSIKAKKAKQLVTKIQAPGQMKQQASVPSLGVNFRNYPESRAGSNMGVLKSPTASGISHQFSTIDDGQVYQQSLLKQKKATIKKKQFMLDSATQPIHQQNLPSNVGSRNRNTLGHDDSHSEFNSTIGYKTRNTMINAGGTHGSMVPVGSLETDELISMRDDLMQQQTNRRESNLPGIPKSKVKPPEEVLAVQKQISQKTAANQGIIGVRDPRYLTKRSQVEDDRNSFGISKRQSNFSNQQRTLSENPHFMGHNQLHSTFDDKQSPSPPLLPVNGNKRESGGHHSRYSSQSKAHNEYFQSKYTLHNTIDPNTRNNTHKHQYSHKVLDQQSQSFLNCEAAAKASIYQHHQFLNSDQDSLSRDDSLNKPRDNSLKAKAVLNTKRQLKASTLATTGGGLGPSEIRRISNQYQAMVAGTMTTKNANIEDNEVFTNRRRSSIFKKQGFKDGDGIYQKSIRNNLPDSNDEPVVVATTKPFKSPKKKQGIFNARHTSLEPQQHSAESTVHYQNNNEVGESTSQQSRRTLLIRPQAVIKIRKQKNDAKLATLRQMSNDPQSRPGRSSLGNEVAVVDNLDEEEDEDEELGSGHESKAVASAVGSTFQKVMEMRTNKRRTEKGLSRNNPLVKLTSNVQQSTMGPPMISDSSIRDSASNNIAYPKNRLPPSLKVNTELSLLGAQALNQVMQSQQNLRFSQNEPLAAKEGSMPRSEGPQPEEKKKIKKKNIRIVQTKVSGDFEKPERIHPHRNSKVISVASSQMSHHEGTRAYSTPSAQVEQQSSKIDKILAKIDRARGDQQIKMILKKASESSHTEDASAKAFDLKRDSQFQASPDLPEHNFLTATLAAPNQILQATQKGRYQSEENRQDTAEESKLLQPKKILKVLNKQAIVRKRDDNPQQSESAANSKVRKLKIKSSQERPEGFGNSNMAVKMPPNVKQVTLRDDKSVESSSQLRGEQSSNAVSDKEFSPSGFMKIGAQPKPAAKQLKIKVKQVGQQQSQDLNEPMVRLMDSIENQESKEQLPNKKKSILHSHFIQPTSLDSQATNQNQAFSSEFLTGSNDPHSTDASTYQFQMTQTSNMAQLKQVPANNGFDQSSICITSASGSKINPLKRSEQDSQTPVQKPMSHMKIQDASLQVQQALNSNHPLNQIFKTSMRENPLEIAQQTSQIYLKISSRYGVAPDAQHPIKEESNEERDSSDNNSQRLTISTFHMPKQRRRVLDNSLENHELQVDPQERDDIMFKEINIVKTSKQNFIQQQQTARYESNQLEKHNRQSSYSSGTAINNFQKRYSHVHQSGITSLNEDDEAVEVGRQQPHKASNAVVLDALDIGGLLQKKSVDKKKHWLLDSGRFNDMITQNQNNQANQNKDNDGGLSSQELNSDTVVIEQEVSSFAGTPPKLANKGKKEQKAAARFDLDANPYDEGDDNLDSSRIIVKNAPPPGRLTQGGTESLLPGMIGEQRHFAFTQESLEEMKEAQHVAMLDKMLEPLLDKSLATQKAVPMKSREVFMKTLNQRLNIEMEDQMHPTNPYWVMQKHLKILPPLEHYMKPTYYDVIYLQPQIFDDPGRPSLSKDIGISQKINNRPILETQFNFD